MSHIPPLYTLKEPSPTSDPAGDDVDLGDMLKIVQFGGEKMMMKMFGALSQEELIQLQLALNKNRCDGDVAGFNASCFDDEEFVNAITLLLKFYEKAASEVPMGIELPDQKPPAPPAPPAPEPPPKLPPMSVPKRVEPTPHRDLDEMVRKAMYMLRKANTLPKNQKRRVVYMVRRR